MVCKDGGRLVSKKEAGRPFFHWRVVRVFLSGVSPAAPPQPGVEVVRRGDRLFVINHSQIEVTVAGTRVAAGDVAVVPVI